MSAAGAPAPPVTLRRLRWWDLERVGLLERELFPGDPWSTETFLSELAQGPARHYVVAAAGEEVLGYAGLAAAGGVADVQTVAVAPAAQGRGVGAVLLQELLAEARRRGCERVLLEVREDNAAARRLYERAGFAEVGRRRRYYQPEGVDAVVMERAAGGDAPADGGQGA